MSALRYAGSISIPVEITPRPQDIDGCVGIDYLHCTLLLPSQLKVIKELYPDFTNKTMKNFVKGIVALHPTPPMLVLDSETHLATRIDPRVLYGDDTVSTYFIVVMNQLEMQEYLDTLTDALGIPNVERFFHVSVANDTGQSNASIGNIRESDLE
mgnify:CR=1 FL=1|tara:strand:- start:76 stop:540 length:465 start_codon:yes stop_codon:yes gene_type:complete